MLQVFAGRVFKQSLVWHGSNHSSLRDWNMPSYSYMEQLINAGQEASRPEYPCRCNQREQLSHKLIRRHRALISCLAIVKEITWQICFVNQASSDSSVLFRDKQPIPHMSKLLTIPWSLDLFRTEKRLSWSKAPFLLWDYVSLLRPAQEFGIIVYIIRSTKKQCYFRTAFFVWRKARPKRHVLSGSELGFEVVGKGKKG